MTLPINVPSSQAVAEDRKALTEKVEKLIQKAGVHRTGSGRAEPMEHRAIRRVAAAGTQAREEAKSSPLLLLDRE